MATRKTKRSAPQLRKGNALKSPSWENWQEWSGEQFHKHKSSSREFYYNNYKLDNLLPSVYKYMDASDLFGKEDVAKVKKLANWELGFTLAIVCKLLNDGMPDYNKKEAEYWESLPGTQGELKPSSEWVNKRIKECIDKGEKVIEQKEEEEKVKPEKYVPSIQERIREATSIMCEFIELAFDEFSTGKITDFKEVQPAKKLRQLGCKQPHARLISTYYLPLCEEYKELLNPPDTSKMTEQQKDWAQQLKEGYAIYDKKQIKKLYEFTVNIIGACDAIIAESKANRKPRKISRKSPEQVVSKMKYKISDDKYSIASIQPHKIVGSNCLVTFNAKTRKLGIYYTSMEDPTGANRDGSGLSVKGTTLERFDEKKSVSCTLRKPIEQLQEVKDLNTRKKFENWFEKLTTTPVKMNGRINQETVLIAVY